MKEYLDKIADEAVHYAEAKFEEKSLVAVEKSVNIMKGLLSWLVIAGILLIIITSLSAVVILLLAKATGGLISATLIMAGFYFVLFIILIAFHERLLGQPIKNFLLGEYLSDYDKK